MEGTVDGQPQSVLIVSRCSRAFGFSSGGADVLASRHAIALARSGLPVVLVTGSTDAVLPGEGKTVNSPPIQLFACRPRGGNLNPLFLLNEFINVIRGTLVGLRLLRSRRFDLVVTNHSVATLLMKLRHPRQPTVHFVHDALHAHRSARHIPEKAVRFLLNDALELLAAHAADEDLCASVGIESQLRELGIPAPKTAAIGPLVGPPSAGPPNRANPTSTSSPLPRSPYVLSVGQQSGRKRFDILIQAMKEVPPEFSLVLVGDGPLHDSYRELAREENLEGRVQFLNAVEDGNLGRIYSGAELFVLVSENEGSPITVAEARAMGRPALFASPSATSGSEGSDPGLTVLPFVPSPEILGRKLTELLAPSRERDPGARTWLKGQPTRPVCENDVVALYARFLSTQEAVPSSAVEP